MNLVLDCLSFGNTLHIEDAPGMFAVYTLPGFHARGVKAASRVTAFGN
jgi:hypothetical protein